MRVLRVLPEQADGQVRVHLWEPNKPVPYHCLSYTWGYYSWDASDREWHIVPSPNKIVLVNGQQKRIGRNLFDFLDMASRRFANAALWIDALCINQADDAEKSTQVQRMDRIYRRAIEVLVWLGNERDVVELFEWIRKEASLWNKASFYVPLYRTPAWLRANQAVFSTHPYWRRTWIIQEVVLARSVRLVCGGVVVEREQMKKCEEGALTNVLPLFWFGVVNEMLISVRRRMGVSREGYINFDRVSSLLDRSNEKRNLEFWDVFDKSSNCVDPRDRVYGVLALNPRAADLEVDYSEHVFDLLWRAGEHFAAWHDPSKSSDLMTGLDINLPTLRSALESHGRGDLPCSIHLRVCRSTQTSQHQSCSAGASAVKIKGCGEHDVLLCPLLRRQRSHKLHYIARRGQDQTDSFTLTEIDSSFPGASLKTITNKRCPPGTRLWRVAKGVESEVTSWADLMHKVPSEEAQGTTYSEGQCYVLRLPFRGVRFPQERGDLQFKRLRNPDHPLSL